MCVVILVLACETPEPTVVPATTPAMDESASQPPSATSPITPFPPGAETPTPSTPNTNKVPTSAELIDQALANGVIDSETALIYKVYVTFGDRRLPAAYRGDDSQVRHTRIMAEVGEQFASLSPEVQRILEPFLPHPFTLEVGQIQIWLQGHRRPSCRRSLRG
jgi:hypothetical protein